MGKDPYLQALEDIHELLDNACSNRAEDSWAPWHWDHELRDQINYLQEQREMEIKERI